MKKLVLLVSVFLLLTGLVFADVTFAPAVTGDASVTWGMDLMPEGQGSTAVNTGFDAANNATFDLGVTIDPFDAMSGEDGMYGEIELTGMGVTAKSGSDVAVTAPSVTAKLYFMEGLYMRVSTNPEPEYDMVSPLGNLVTIDDNEQEGTWYDGDEDDLDTTVKAAYGNAGYGFTYMMDALTVDLDFVSNNAWGTVSDTEDRGIDFDDDDEDGFWELDDADDGGNEDGYIDTTEAAGYEAILDAAVAAIDVVDDCTFDLVWVYNETVGDFVLVLNEDGEALLSMFDEDGNFVEETTTVVEDTDYTGDSLYTLGVTVTYDIEGIGEVMAYVLPQHASEWDTFSTWGYGGKITVDAVDMVTPVLAADLQYNENAVTDSSKFDTLEWEAYAELPVSYEMSEDMSFDVTAKMAATDSDVDEDGAERIVYDAYFSAGADVMGASVDAAYQISELFYDDNTSSSMTLAASYGLDAMGGTITPSVAYDVDFGEKEIGNDEEGYLTVAVAAEVVDNTTFTLKYATGDILVAEPNTEDLGVVTFETKIAY